MKKVAHALSFTWTHKRREHPIVGLGGPRRKSETLRLLSIQQLNHRSSGGSPWLIHPGVDGGGGRRIEVTIGQVPQHSLNHRLGGLSRCVIVELDHAKLSTGWWKQVIIPELLSFWRQEDLVHLPV